MFKWNSINGYFKDPSFVAASLHDLLVNDLVVEEAEESTRVDLLNIREATLRSPPLPSLLVQENFEPGALVWGREKNQQKEKENKIPLWPCIILDPDDLDSSYSQYSRQGKGIQRKPVLWMGERTISMASVESFIRFDVLLDREHHDNPTNVIKRLRGKGNIGGQRVRKFRAAIKDASFLHEHGYFSEDEVAADSPSDANQKYSATTKSIIQKTGKRDDAELSDLREHINMLQQANAPAQSINVLLSSSCGDFIVSVAAIAGEETYSTSPSNDEYTVPSGTIVPTLVDWKKATNEMSNCATSLCCHANLNELTLENILAACRVQNQARMETLQERMETSIQEQLQTEIQSKSLSSMNIQLFVAKGTTFMKTFKPHGNFKGGDFQGKVTYVDEYGLCSIEYEDGDTEVITVTEVEECIKKFTLRHHAIEEEIEEENNAKLQVQQIVDCTKIGRLGMIHATKEAKSETAIYISNFKITPDPTMMTEPVPTVVSDDIVVVDQMPIQTTWTFEHNDRTTDEDQLQWINQEFARLNGNVSISHAGALSFLLDNKTFNDENKAYQYLAKMYENENENDLSQNEYVSGPTCTTTIYVTDKSSHRIDHAMAQNVPLLQLAAELILGCIPPVLPRQAGTVRTSRVLGGGVGGGQPRKRRRR